MLQESFAEHTDIMIGLANRNYSGFPKIIVNDGLNQRGQAALPKPKQDYSASGLKALLGILD
jgi:hypothetical protein